MNQENIIHSYTRQQAIEEGLQICVSDLFPSDTRMYKYPVYFTLDVWKLTQGQGVVVWDICYMAAAAKARQSDRPIIQYSVIVQDAERTPDFIEDDCPIYRLLAECGAKDLDDPTPVITIMFPEER